MKCGCKSEKGANESKSCVREAKTPVANLRYAQTCFKFDARKGWKENKTLSSCFVNDGKKSEIRCVRTELITSQLELLIQTNGPNYLLKVYERFGKGFSKVF